MHILLFLNNRELLLIFADVGGGGGYYKLVIFCECHKCMAPNVHPTNYIACRNVHRAVRIENVNECEADFLLHDTTSQSTMIFVSFEFVTLFVLLIPQIYWEGPEGSINSDNDSESL